MTSAALVVTVLSSFIWVAAMAHRRLNVVRRFTPEFWWSWSAVVSSGLGALFSIGVFSGGSLTASAVRTGPLIITGLVLVASSAASRSAAVSWAGGMVAAYFAVLLAFGLGGEPIGSAVLSLAVFLPVIISRRDGYDHEQIRQGLRAGCIITVLAIAAIAMAQPGGFFGPCRYDKCSLWGISIGTAGDGNALGIFYAVAGAISFMIVKGVARTCLVAVSSLALVELTSSRTALYSWAVGALIVAAHHLCTRLRSNTPQAAVVIALGAVCVVLPLLPWRGDEFTYRATLWLSARNLITESPLFGYGSAYWVRLGGESGVSSNYSTHNLTLEVLMSGGLLGLLLFTGGLVAAVLSNQRREGRLWTLSFIAILLSTSMTEVTSAPGRPYLIPGLAVLAFLAVGPSRGASSPSAHPLEPSSSASAVRALVNTDPTVESAGVGVQPDVLLDGSRRSSGP